MRSAPPEFVTALAAIRHAEVRPEISLTEIPAPARLAPFAVALSAEVMESPDAQRLDIGAASESELATGRFILLHDPAGSPMWGGDFRIVTYIRAQLEAEMGNDELLGSVAWTWLLDALDEHKTSYKNAGGTATRVLSQSFGTLADRSDGIDIELRASWTPPGPNVQEHLEAWSTMVCTFAGLPPLPEGVSAIPRRRLS